VIVHADANASKRPGFVFTAARIEVEPNAPTTVPSCARLWLDARASDPDEVQRWRTAVVDLADHVAADTGTTLDVRTAAWSTGTAFPEEVCSALLGGLERGAPSVVCYAGHDAGVIAQRRPAGMVLVRNESGVSHAPEEHVALEDAAAGARALLATTEALA
jgi:N-carbamoyl-L-amino-acid hydrolase